MLCTARPRRFCAHAADLGATPRLARRLLLPSGGRRGPTQMATPLSCQALSVHLRRCPRALRARRRCEHAPETHPGNPFPNLALRFRCRHLFDDGAFAHAPPLAVHRRRPAGALPPPIVRGRMLTQWLRVGNACVCRRCLWRLLSAGDGPGALSTRRRRPPDETLLSHSIFFLQAGSPPMFRSQTATNQSVLFPRCRDA